MKKNVMVNKTYKLTKDAAPLSFMLPTRNSRRYPLMYFDESTGTNRALRYARNQKSPFEDEQDGNAIVGDIHRFQSAPILLHVFRIIELLNHLLMLEFGGL